MVFVHSRKDTGKTAEKLDLKNFPRVRVQLEFRQRILAVEKHLVFESDLKN